MGKTITELGSTALSSGLSFLGNLGGSIASGLFNANQAKINRKFQERMYDKQVQDNINFWKMQQEYNLPSAQLQRIKDAGLNPLLMYGEGGLTGNVAGQAPQSGTAPHGAQAQASFHTPIEMANVALLRAQTANLNADTKNKLSQSKESESRTELNNFDLAFKADTREISIGKMVSEYDLNKSLEALNREQRYNLQAQTKRIDAEIKAIIQDMENKKELTAAQINDINQRLAGFNKKLSHEIENLDAQTREYYANAFVAQVTGNYLKELYSEDYINILKGQAGQDLLNAIKYGRGIDIENALKAIEYEVQPKPGTNYFEYNRFMKFGMEPMIGVLKDAAIGGASLYFLKGGAKALPRIGYVK